MLSDSLFLRWFLGVENDRYVVGTLADATGAALRARTDSLERTTFVYHYGLDDNLAVVKCLGVVLVLCFPVGDGTAEKFLKPDRCLFL